MSPLGLAENRTKIKRSDLKRIGLLGCGGFGAVELWEHSKTGPADPGTRDATFFVERRPKDPRYK